MDIVLAEDKKIYNVSVIIPIYNADLYLDECINSVLSQSLSRIEIICIDDGSNDKSVDIIKRYCAKYDQIRLIEQSNSGAGKARNRGISEANGEFVAFLDADDLFYDVDTLEKLYNFAKKQEVKICGGNTIMFDSDWKNGRKYNPGPREIISENRIYHYSEYGCIFGYTRFIYERDFLLKYNVFFPQYACWEDPVFMTKAFSIVNEFYACKDYVYCYRRQTHRKEHRIEDAFELIKASVDMMETAKRFKNCNLVENVLEVILNSYENISYAYSVRPDLVMSGIKTIKNYVCDIDDVRFDRLIEGLNEVAFEQENNNYNNDLSELLKLISNGKDFVVYGAGEYGKRLFWLVNDLGYRPIGFAETEKSENLKSMLGVPLRTIDEWENIDCIFLISVKNKDLQIEMKRIISDRRLNGYVVSDRLLNRTICLENRLLN